MSEFNDVSPSCHEPTLEYTNDPLLNALAFQHKLAGADLNVDLFGMESTSLSYRQNGAVANSPPVSESNPSSGEVFTADEVNQFCGNNSDFVDTDAIPPLDFELLLLESNCVQDTDEQLNNDLDESESCHWLNHFMNDDSDNLSESANPHSDLGDGASDYSDSEIPEEDYESKSAKKKKRRKKNDDDSDESESEYNPLNKRNFERAKGHRRHKTTASALKRKTRRRQMENEIASACRHYESGDSGSEAGGDDGEDEIEVPSTKKQKGQGSRPSNSRVGMGSSTTKNDVVANHRPKGWTQRNFESRQYLRFISALLESTGLRRVQSSNYACVPASSLADFDCVKSFRPEDAIRFIVTGVEKLEKDEPDNRAAEGIIDWSDWTTPVLKDHCDSDEENDDLPKVYGRIYYASRMKNYVDDDCVILEDDEEDDCWFSISKQLEMNGRPTYAPEVVSSVGSAKLRLGESNRKFDLEAIAKRCSNVEFSGPWKPLVFTLREPKSTAYLYLDGRLIVVGTKSSEDMRKASRRFARIVEKAMGEKVLLSKISLHVCVGFVKLPFLVRVDAMMMHKQLPQIVKHDKSDFAGAILKIKETSAVVLILESGSVLILGVAKFGSLKETLDLIYPCMRSFGY